MIPVSSRIATLLSSAHYTVRPWVVILPHQILLGGQEDVSTRTVAFTVNASMDQPLMSASVTVNIGSGSDTYSPFYTGSSHRTGSQPLMAPGANILVGFYIGDIADPGFSEPIKVFEGRINGVSALSKDGTVTLDCTDLGQWWLNTQLQQGLTEQSYGAVDGSTDVYDVMLQIGAAANNDGDIGLPLPALYAPRDFGWYQFVPDPGPFLEIWRAMAQQAGRDVRWFSSKNLAYYEPDRAPAGPDLVIGGRRYISITELTWEDPDVRNIWEVWFSDADGNVLGPARISDPTSISLYGPRFARIYLTRAENIRTIEDAALFAEFALIDNKDPFASHSIVMPLEPRVELNDYHLYEANHREYDIDLQFAVAGFRHEFRTAQKGSQGVTQTTIQARGKPIAARRDYRRSVPPKTLVSTQEVDPNLWAPEGTVYYQVDNLD